MNSCVKMLDPLHYLLFANIRRKMNVCQKCKRGVTFSEISSGWGVFLKSGRTKQQAKDMGTICYRCAKAIVEQEKRDGEKAVK